MTELVAERDDLKKSLRDSEAELLETEEALIRMQAEAGAAAAAAGGAAAGDSEPVSTWVDGTKGAYARWCGWREHGVLGLPALRWIKAG